MAKKIVTQPNQAQQVELYSLQDLHLDSSNPRFGSQAGAQKDESKILDFIVDNFGVDDVLSSIAVNGYFGSEPLVGCTRPKKAGITIVEGNRRLAACLILTGDERAKHHRRRTRSYEEMRKKSGAIPPEIVPVIVYPNTDYEKILLPYLGVTHIAGAQPWDSFAKAAWIAGVLDGGKLTLEDIAQMIGDQHRTVPRILEGYYFVNQLIDAGRFNPDDSLPKGRGSNVAYPFSWLYTALGFKPIRAWVKLPDLDKDPHPRPIPKDALDNAESLLSYLFGNKSRGIEPAVPDSRDIARLAVTLGTPQQRRLLAQGLNVRQVEERTKPHGERALQSLGAAAEALRRVWQALGEGKVDDTAREELKAVAQEVNELLSNILKNLNRE